MKHRSRIIKGEFFQNRKLAGLSAHHRLLFIGLWLIADREGRLQDDPDLIGGMIFPFENVQIDKLLTDLAEFGFIVRYGLLDGVDEAYIYIPKFLEHQKIHTHEAKSKLPPPENVIKCSVMSPTDSEISIGRGNSNSNSRSIEVEEEVRERPPFEDIIGHLNQLTGKNFRPNVNTNRKWIRARWNEGFRLDDFIYVNQIKAEEWLGTEREKYLRPETLYGNKFEGYRQQRHIPRQYSEKTNKALVAAAKYLQQEGVEIEGTRQKQISGSNT